MLPLRIALITSLVLCSTSTALAQSVRGTVRDQDTDEPIRGAAVTLMEADRSAQRTVTTDSAGRFVLSARGFGRYQLRASRLGYRSALAPPIDLDTRETIEVVLHLSTEAIVLAPLTIETSRQPLRSSRVLVRRGFYDRQESYTKLGVGHFLDRAAIEKRSPMRISDLLQTVPGVRVIGAGGRRTTIALRGGCEPLIYLDGVPFRLHRGEHIDDYVPASSLAGVEVYPGLTQPAEFMDIRPTFRPCGSVVLWTGGKS